jgi:hypothetical protein
MEKVFSWKVLVSFCAVFIVTWILLQTVSTMRLESEAELIGSSLYCWNWPGSEWHSQAEMTEASIIRKGDNDAVVKVSGKQILTAGNRASSLDNSQSRSETVDCSAVLTLYRKSGKWVLGRVEL